MYISKKANIITEVSSLGVLRC